MNLLKKMQDELVESILDLPKKKLDSDMWSGETLKKEHKTQIIDTFEKWAKKMKLEIKSKHYYIMGSTTTYQYTDTSDIDVDIVCDLSKDKLKELVSLLPNGNLLKGTQHPINYYMAPDDSNIKKSETLYDLESSKWIRKPKKSEVKIPKAYVSEVAKFFMDGLDLRISEYERDVKDLEMLEKQLKDDDLDANKEEIERAISSKKEELRADLDAIHIGHHVFHAFRKEAFETPDYEPQLLIKIETKGNPNLSINNMIYKELERHGYLEKVSKYEKLRDKELKA